MTTAETTMQAADNDTWSEGFATALQEHRQRMAERLQSERQRIGEAEQQLSAHMLKLAEDFSTQGELAAEALHTTLTDSLLEQIETLRREVQETSQGWKAQSDSSAAESAALTEELRQTREELARQITELASKKAEQESLAANYREQLQSLEEERQSLAQKAAELESQEARIDERRRSVAQRLRARKAEQNARLEQTRTEVLRRGMSEDLELAQQLHDANEEASRLREELGISEALSQALTDQVNSFTDEVKRLESDLKRERQTSQDHEEQLRNQQSEADAERERFERELSQLRATCDSAGEAADGAAALRAELAEAQVAWETERKSLGEAVERAEYEHLQALEENEAANAQVEELGSALTELETGRVALEKRCEQLADVESQLDELKLATVDGNVELETLTQQVEDARAASRREVSEVQERLDTAQTENEELRAERQQLQDQLQQSAASGEDESHELRGELEDLRRRFEIAVQEVRELKNANVDLKRKVEAAPATAAPTLPSSGFDWESQKQMLLAELENGLGGDDRQQEEDKMTVEGAIRLTDQVVAEKDELIEELQRQLRDLPTEQEDTDDGQTAELLDKDAVVKAERDKLQTLQEEWRDKLRQAELDVSLERAKLARERIDLEEQIRSLESERHHASKSSADEKTEPAQGKKSGKWLARLGLSKDEDD